MLQTFLIINAIINANKLIGVPIWSLSLIARHAIIFFILLFGSDIFMRKTAYIFILFTVGALFYFCKFISLYKGSMCINMSFKYSVELIYKIYFESIDIKVTLLYEKYINVDISMFILLYFRVMSVGGHENF